jgi:hypothetical protein
MRDFGRRCARTSPDALPPTMPASGNDYRGREVTTCPTPISHASLSEELR